MASSSENYLIEEGADWFKLLISNYKTKEAGNASSNSIDIIALALHGFMIELGFQVEDRVEIPEGWRSQAGYSTRYWYLPSKEASILLSLTSLGPLIKVHGINKTTKEIFSTSISYCNFLTEAGDLKNTAQLARSFKNEVGLPLLTSVRIELGLSLGLANFAPEILLKIVKYLDVRSLLSLSRTSAQFNSLSKEESVWKHFYSRDFKDQNLEGNGNWYKLYCDQWKKEKEREKERNRRRILPEPRHPGGVFPVPDFSSEPGPPWAGGIPGMVGGDYDRFPMGGPPNPLFPNLGLPRPRFDPPGPNFPGRGPPMPRGGGRGGFGGGGFGGGGFGGFF